MKRKLTKRILGSLLCVAMCLGMLAGCGSTEGTKDSETTDVVNNEGSEAVAEENKSPEDYPTLRVFNSCKEYLDVALIEEALSEYTREKIGANIDLVQIPGSEYQQKVSLMLASQEQMDIGWDSGTDFRSKVSQGAYMDIAGLLDQHPDLKGLYTDEFLLGTSENDAIYGIPTLKEMGEQWGFMVETSLLTDNNIDPSELKTMEDMEVVFEAAKKIEGSDIYNVYGTTQQDALTILPEYSLIYGDFYLKNGTTEIVNYYCTEDYAEYTAMVRDWYNKGYIDPDVATKEAEYLYESGVWGVNFISYAPGSEFTYEAKLGAPVTYIPMTPAVTTNTSLTGSVWGVYNKCENPELAVAFLELWNTDPYVKNLILYGIEGKHYEVVDGKANKIPEMKDAWNQQNWKTGNVMIATLLTTEQDDLYTKYYKEFNESCVVSESLGFWPDVTSIEAELLACTAAKEEYANLLSCGVVDPTEYIPKLQKALEEAGVEKVLTELQKQYDAWMAAK